MIPVLDVIPSRRAPLVTLGLIVVCGGIHLTGTLHGATTDAWLSPNGGRVGTFSPARVLLGLFRHDAWLPLVANLLFLWLFGENVEDRLGRVRFACLYLGAGLAAGAVSSIVPGHGSSLGAHAAVSGVLGAYVVLFPHSRVLTLVPLPGLFDLVEVSVISLAAVWFLLQLVLARGGLALLANVAGFGAGAVLVVLAGGRGRRDRYWVEHA